MPSATVLNVASTQDLHAGAVGLTLRQAIDLANTNANPAGYIIQLQGNTTYQITLANAGGVSEDQNTSGDFDIEATVPVTIQGGLSGGTVIEGFSGGSSPDRVFDVGPKGKVTFQNVTLEGGQTTSDGGGLRTAPGSIVKLTNTMVQDNKADGDGGGIAAGYTGFGGSNRGRGGSLTLTDSLVQNNTGGLGSGGSQSHGGGIASINQALMIHHSAIRNNASGFSGGNLQGVGGGVYVADPSASFRGGTNVVIDQESAISNNRAFGSQSGDGGQGGGLFIFRQDITRITDSIIGGPSGGNEALASFIPGGDGGAAGGIGAIGGTLILDHTTVQLNRAEGNLLPSGIAGLGGGIAAAFETLRLRNDSRVQGNIAGGSAKGGGVGGGIFANEARVEITDSTIGGSGGSDGNTAGAAASGGAGLGGGIFAVGLGTFLGKLVLTNSLVSHNTAAAPSGGDGGEGGGIFASGLNTVKSEVRITDSEISHNSAAAGAQGGAGGGLALSSAHVRLSGGAVRGNAARGGSGGGLGGGIFLDGSGSTLEITGQALITQNTAEGGLTSGLGGAGGGIYLLGSGSGFRDFLNLRDSTVSANRAQSSSLQGGSGGGIFSNGGIIKLTRATIGGPLAEDGNTAEGSSGGSGGAGGGIFAINLPSVSKGAALLAITRSSISHNTAGSLTSSGTSRGGGMALNGVGSASIFASTIDHNSALSGPGEGASGGGISTGSASGGTNLSITNSTLSGNVAAAGSGGDGGGLFATSFDTIKLLNNTIAYNQSGNSEGGSVARGEGGGSGKVSVENTIIANNKNPASQFGNDVAGTFNSLGHNLIGFAPSGGSSGFINGVNGDLVGTDFNNPLDPGLDSLLKDNGGPTLTHALLPGSIAINAANSHAPNTDQRGVVRVKPDIGAFEIPESSSSSRLMDSGSLDPRDQ